MPENSGPKQARTKTGQFAPGTSGNPRGKPKGTRHRVTLLAEKLMEDDAEAVVRAVLAAAKDGDVNAARMIIDRIAPPRKGRTVELELPPVRTAADVCAAQAAVIEAVAGGDVTPEQGAVIAGLLEHGRRAIETADLEQRLAQLEQRMRLQ